MNNDLISRSALKRAFEDTVCIEPMPYAFVKQIIDNAPTVEERADILYLCDTRITDCKKTSCQTDCFLTHDIKHAKNFKHIKGANCFVENEGENRPHGKWVNIQTSVNGFDGQAECNLCGCVVHNDFSNYANFCPNCGAQMIGGEDHD